MKPLRATEAEQPEIFAIIKREIPAIHRAALKMAKQLRGLTDVSQKMAITELTTVWIKTLYPDDLDLQLSIAEAFRDQTEIHLKETFRLEARQKQH